MPNRGIEIAYQGYEMLTMLKWGVSVSFKLPMGQSSWYRRIQVVSSLGTCSSCKYPRHPISALLLMFLTTKIYLLISDCLISGYYAVHPQVNQRHAHKTPSFLDCECVECRALSRRKNMSSESQRDQQC